MTPRMHAPVKPTRVTELITQAQYSNDPLAQELGQALADVYAFLRLLSQWRGLREVEEGCYFAHRLKKFVQQREG